MYRARLVRVQDGEKMLKLTDDLSIEFDGLLPDTEYDFVVQGQAANNGIGIKTGPYSEPLRTRTIEPSGKILVRIDTYLDSINLLVKATTFLRKRGEMVYCSENQATS